MFQTGASFVGVIERNERKLHCSLWIQYRIHLWSMNTVDLKMHLVQTTEQDKHWGSFMVLYSWMMTVEWTRKCHHSIRMRYFQPTQCCWSLFNNEWERANLIDSGAFFPYITISVNWQNVKTRLGDPGHCWFGRWPIKSKWFKDSCDTHFFDP